MKRMRWNNIKFRKVKIHEIGERALLINLYFTQSLIVVLALTLMWWLDINPVHLFTAHSVAGVTIITYGILFAVVVLISDVILTRWIPKHVTDDGGMNEKIFANRPVWHIIVICIVVSIGEELLFRGAIQSAIGVYWTSVLFAAVHVRYLQHWLMTSLVFAISYGLGWIYVQTGTIATPIIAHFLIDFVLGFHLRSVSKR